MILLKAEDICKSVKNGKGETEILKNISLEIEKGSFTVIMGSSGAGKSTLLYALSGTDKISGGKIYLNGEEISSANEKRLSEIRTKSFGFVFQEGNLVSNLTLEENIKVAGFLKKDRSEKETCLKVDELLEKMNLKEAAKRLPVEASGGENQRCAIARAVINEPEIIFADEPTGALNRANSDEVLKLFTDLNNGGQTILMVTHDLKSAVRGEKIIYLEDGKIEGTLEMGKFAVGNCGNAGGKNGQNCKNGSSTEAEREKFLSDWLQKKGW